MIGIEFRDEDYAELVDEAKKLVKQAHHMKKTACKIIKALAAMDEEEPEDEEEDEMEDMGGDEIALRHTGDRTHGDGVIYYRGGRTKMRRGRGGRYGY